MRVPSGRLITETSVNAPSPALALNEFAASLFAATLFAESLFAESLFAESLFAESLFPASLFVASLFPASLFVASLAFAVTLIASAAPTRERPKTFLNMFMMHPLTERSHQM